MLYPSCTGKVTLFFKEDNSKKALLFSLVLGAMLATSFFIVSVFFRGESFAAYAWLPKSAVLCALISCALGLVLAGAFYLLLTRFPVYWAEAGGHEAPGLGKRIVFSRKGIAFCGIVIFLFWLPITILMYPAVSNMDFFNQIYQFQASAPTYYTTMGIVVDAEFIDHHPVFDTLVFGLFYSLGDAIGSQNVGLFLLTLCESASLAIMLGLAVCYLERLGLPGAVRVGALVFAIFFPYYAPFAADSTKDTLFAIAFIPFVICYMEAFRTSGEVLRNSPFLVAFILATGFCLLTKKLGVFICVPSLLLLLLFVKQGRRYLASAVVLVVVVFSFAIPNALHAALDVAPGGKQETLFIPLQQTVTLLKAHPEEFTDDDLAKIDKVINLEKAQEKYDRLLADGVKNTFRPDVTSIQISEYLSLWSRGALRHPILYVEATLMCSARLVLPSTSMGFDVDIASPEIRERWTRNFNSTSEGFDFKAERPTVLLDAATKVRDFLMNEVSSIPIIGLLTTRGFYGGWLPFVCIAISLFNRKRDCAALIPVILTVLSLLISPGSLARYVHSLMFVIIPMVSWMLYSFRDKRVAVPKESLDK